MRALLTAAAPSQRRLPLQTVTDRSGITRPVLELILEDAFAAGVTETGLVVFPGDGPLFREAAGAFADRIAIIEQPVPRGYGHAVWCAREFLASEAFLLLVSDHLYVSDDPARPCARQLVEHWERERCAVSAVQATHESQLPYFGTVGGRLFDGRPGLFAIDKVREKPTPTVAEQELLVPGLRHGHYHCFFGLHVLTPTVLEELDLTLGTLRDDEKLPLSPALDALARRERYLAAELQGRRFDLDRRHGLLLAQLALALEGRHREELLEALVALLAGRR